MQLGQNHSVMMVSLSADVVAWEEEVDGLEVDLEDHSVAASRAVLLDSAYDGRAGPVVSLYVGGSVGLLDA